MALYTYRAADTKNQIISDTIAASSLEEAAADLEKRGLTPLSVQPVKSSTLRSEKSLPIVEKITFCRYASTMLKSGLSITESISVLAEEAIHPVMKKILDDLNFGIKHGQSISSVLSHHPKSFDNFFITIIQAGEVSGTLSEAFSQIEQELRAEHSLKQKISGALLYPGVVFGAMLGIGVLMFFFVLPQIGKVFLTLTLPLPFYTRKLFEITLYLNRFTALILIGVAISVVAFILFMRTPLGKSIIMKVFTPIPVVKNLIKQVDMARFCRVFSTLLKSGVPITDALEISLNTLSYPKFRQVTKPIIEQVTKGQSLSSAFKTTKIFPSLLTQMIASGEKSGTLDDSLRDLGSFYEEEVESAVKKSASWSSRLSLPSTALSAISKPASNLITFFFFPR
jgi:type II secretory pathway component PulF